MLKRRSGKKYVRNGLLCIPEGYLAEKMAYIGEICARSGWIIIHNRNPVIGGLTVDPLQGFAAQSAGLVKHVSTSRRIFGRTIDLNRPNFVCLATR